MSRKIQGMNLKFQNSEYIHVKCIFIARQPLKNKKKHKTSYFEWQFGTNVFSFYLFSF